MTERLPTVKVKIKGDKSKQTFTINMTDFDNNKHEMVSGEELPPLPPLDPAKKEELYGSSKQPDSWTLPSGEVLQLGAVVAKAHENSGLTVEQWNALPQDDREAMIAEMVAQMVPTPVPLKVAKRGRGAAMKFFIMGADGNQVGEEEFATEAEAEAKLEQMKAA